MSRPLCVVVGVGPGNGAAVARRFHRGGYAIALLSRSTTFTSKLAEELGDAWAYSCDVGDTESVKAAFENIVSDSGKTPDVLIYNAGSGVFSNIENTSAEAFELSWRVNAMGLFHCSKQVIDGMKEKGKGAIVITGATASLRGGANFAAFASAKAAQRNLAQSMARHLWPSGIHVALVIVDGMIDLPRTREMMKGKSDDFFLRPADIAETYYRLTEQPKSAWSFEVDVRPFAEKW